jgi:hypothetical protein
MCVCGALTHSNLSYEHDLVLFLSTSNSLFLFFVYVQVIDGHPGKVGLSSFTLSKL